MNSVISIPLRHVQQRSTWDCGVSTVAMVLNSEDSKYLRKNLKQISVEEGFKNSTWTVDLSYLLYRFKVSHLFCTITLGVHPEYNKEDFYKSVINKDEKRVEEKFQRAESLGIQIQKRSVKLKEILDHLSKMLPAIVLVNSNLINCKNCQANKYFSDVLKWCLKHVPYQGHYIVLCGFEDETKMILYRNPSHHSQICRMSYETFEKARHSHGTDEDILFILNV